MKLGHWQDQTARRKANQKRWRGQRESRPPSSGTLDSELASGLTVHPVLEMISNVIFHLLLPAAVHRGAKITLKCSTLTLGKGDGFRGTLTATTGKPLVIQCSTECRTWYPLVQLLSSVGAQLPCFSLYARKAQLLATGCPVARGSVG